MGLTRGLFPHSLISSKTKKRITKITSNVVNSMRFQGGALGLSAVLCVHVNIVNDIPD